MIAEKSLWNVFKKQEDPKELVRKWQRVIRTEIRGVERQMLGAQLPVSRTRQPRRFAACFIACCRKHRHLANSL